MGLIKQSFRGWNLQWNLYFPKIQHPRNELGNDYYPSHYFKGAVTVRKKLQLQILWKCFCRWFAKWRGTKLILCNLENSDCESRMGRSF